ncbi:conjugative transfer protein [Vibrio cincinnatiensis]|uniref:conjugative transfer protein n=1 Tax=Vibrio cincinnatiensis TaxID=675 RepID=UPI001EDC9EA3|nr:conjugative transfer protein [Vibrio cincinnatiensis]MCG3760700.1 conjugative transfer protein [Vibrio cincinnatiensis]
MHHSVCLKMTTLTSKEMLAQWQQHNPQFKETLRLLETDWPHALASVYCLADYLTDAFTLDGHSIFDLCLCNGLGAYEDASCDDDSVRLWYFIDALTWTAASALTGIRVIDPDHFEWAAVDGVYLHAWIRNRPNRMVYLAEGLIDVRYVSGHTTTNRLQQVIKSRVMTPTVAFMLAQVEEGTLREQA